MPSERIESRGKKGEDNPVPTPPPAPEPRASVRTSVRASIRVSLSRASRRASDLRASVVRAAVLRASAVRAAVLRSSLRARLLSVLAVVTVAAVALAALAGTSGISGTSTATSSSLASIVMTPTPWASAATPAPTVSPTPAAPTRFLVAVVARYDDTRASISPEALMAALAAGKVTVPCEFSEVGLGLTNLTISPATPCLPAGLITAMVHDTAGTTALLPSALVTPSVKVLALGNTDLFGAPSVRSRLYSLAAGVAVPVDWTGYDSSQVRTLISTGDTCPDTGFAHSAVKLGYGWPWVLNGGTVHYVGLTMDTLYDGPNGKGWPVPIWVRNGDSGKVSALISDNDVSVNDFECPMVKTWKENTTGVKVFSVDPRVAPMLAANGGLKAVTLGSNHITDAGLEGVRETLDDLDAAGIKHTGAGRTLAEALAPALVYVRGITFAFVGWDDISGSAAATATKPGVAPMTDDNVCNSIKAARKVADIVIAMPQWGWPEYHATMTKEQVTQRALFYQCGADDILGSGTHWASWVSILPGPNGPQFAIGSHGNFLFTQNWSRQTMEGVVVEATFYGKKLVQFRLHPYVVAMSSQPNLLDPTADGAYVLHQLWSVSDVK